VTVRRSRRRPVTAIAAVLAGAAVLLAAGPVAQAEEAVVTPGTFTLEGAGWGHGVGMSQWGAFGMARAGHDAASIVRHYYQGTEVSPVQDDMDIRAALLYQVPRALMRSEALDPSGGSIEVTVGPTVTVGGPLDEFAFTVRGSDVGVTRTAGGQAVDLGSAPTVTVRWAGTRTPGTAVGGPTLLNVARTREGLASPGHRYRYGTVDVVPVSTSSGVRLNVVNSVRLHDEYLYGISEVSSSWPEAALQAQAMAARTYALSKVASGVRQACSCHVDDGGGPYFDQTFTGWGKASAAMGERWVAAVNATMASEVAGLAILHQGKPIRAFYHSSSGGATQSVQDVWGGTLPYVVSVPDPWMNVPENPNASWRVVVPQAQMAAAFGVPAVSSVDVVERNPSGAVKAVQATTPEGAVVRRTGPQWATALKLKSRYVRTVDGKVGPALPADVAPTPPTAPVPVPDPAVPAPPPEPAAPSADQPTVSLLSPAAVTVGKGQRYKVVGIVRPAKGNLRVQRQKLVGDVWKTLDTDMTNAKGRYRFVIPDAGRKAPGTYRILVLRKGNVLGVSPEFGVTLG
jgi:SpoIID/LytB domain protein